jgi:hypothetical protein
MLNYNATIERKDDTVNLVLSAGANNYCICLTDDNPSEVKNVFNDLIIELKKGKFSFTLKDKTQDLYFHICDEYIKQLNGEIADVFSQLKKYNLVEKVER